MRKFLSDFKKIAKLLFAIFYLFYKRFRLRNKSEAIAQVVDSFYAGGLEQVACNIYKGFRDNGDDSYIISINNKLGPICQQLDSPAHLRMVSGDISEFIKFCAKKNIYTLVFHFSVFHMKLLKLLGFRNYYIIHNTYIWYENNDWDILKEKLKYSDGIFAVSDWCREYFVRKTGIDRVKTILNGINLDRLRNSENTTYTRKNLGINDNEKIFLTVAAFTQGKHQMGLIGIMEEIMKSRKDIKFLCVGHMLDLGYYKKFMKVYEKSVAAKNIILLDYVPQEEMGSFIKTMCDVYMQPSIHEAGVPLTVMEALCSGKPVLMTDFLVRKTFPKSDAIFLAPTPYANIDDVTPAVANKIALKTKTRATKIFVEQIIHIADNIEEITASIDVNDYSFLSKDNMIKKYIENIALKRI